MSNILAVVQKPATTSENLNLIIILITLVIIGLLIYTIMSNRK